MKTLDKKILLKEIKTLEDGKAFIKHLNECGKLFHFDDDPFDIECFTPWEAWRVELRTTELFKIDNWGKFEDPFQYAMNVLYTDY